MDADKSEFRFVVDGLRLSEADHARIAAAVQVAGLKAIADLGQEQPAFNVGFTFPDLGWRGIWIYVGDRALGFRDQLEQLTRG